MKALFLLLISLIISGNKLFAQDKFEATFRDKQNFYNLSMERSETICGTSNIQCVVKKISVVSKIDKKELQIITPPEDNCNYCFSGLDSSITFAFVAEDMNFDGYTDFRLMNFMPAFSWNVSYYYWLYSPSSKTFARDTTLEQIQGPEFNQSAKEIKNYWNYDGESGSNTHKYIKGKLTLIETEQTKTVYIGDKPKTITTRKKLINGKWVKVK